MWCSSCKVNHQSQRVCVPHLRARLDRTKRKKKQTPFHPRHLAQGRRFFIKRDYRALQKVDLTSPKTTPKREIETKQVLVTSPSSDTPCLRKKKDKRIEVARKLFEGSSLEEAPPISDLESVEDSAQFEKTLPVRVNSEELGGNSEKQWLKSMIKKETKEAMVQTDNNVNMVDASVGTEILILDENQKPEYELHPVEENEERLTKAELEADFIQRLDLVQKETLLTQEFPSIARLRKGPNKSRQKVTVEIENMLDQYLKVRVMR